MRAYLRLDPNLADRKHDYPDGAHRAFTDTLCFAEQQPHRGRFRSAKLLAVLLDKRARWIKYLVEHGDLIEQPDGSLYVDGWDEWQEGDWKVHERVARIRNKKRRGDTPPTDTGVTPDVTVPTVDTPLSGGGRRKADSGKHSSGGGAPLSNGGASPVFLGFPPRKPERLTDEQVASYRRFAVESTDPLVRQSARETLEKAGYAVEESA